MWKKLQRTAAYLLAVAVIWSGIPQNVSAREAQNTENEVAQQAEAREFVHPGMLHTDESFAAMQKNVAEKVQPAYDTWTALKSNGFSADDWNPRVSDKIIRGGTGDNCAGFRIDVRRAYQTALIWRLSGSEAHGKAACRILNAWSAKKPPVEGNADRFLAAGIYGYELANVAEMMRDHPDFDGEAMEEWLLDVFYPMTDDFLKNHNGAHFGNYWANWDLCNIASMMAIGIFTDRADIYEQAVDYYKTGIGMGSLYNAMPYVYDEGLAQWQEAGRDQGHTTLGVSLLGPVCEMAWNQGDDLYSLSDNRFLKGAEYVAKYNNDEEVPYSPYERYAGQNGAVEWGNEISAAGRGSVRPVYSLVYNHYVNRMGLSAPNIEKTLKEEDGSWKLELESAKVDELGWQTLTFAGTGKREEAKETDGVFADGVYRIRSAYTKKSLISDGDGKLSFARRGYKNTEWWKFENTGDGEYVITNTVTGQVIQTGTERYVNGTEFETAQRTEELRQRFAVLPDGEGNYRLIASVNDFALSLNGNGGEDTTSAIQWKYHAAAGQRWIIETKEEAQQSDRWLLAEFDFDDTDSGFECRTAKATGNYTLVEGKDEEHGRALYLDGSAEQYLTVTDREGGSLLAGSEEATISFEAKPDRTDTNWAFYAAPDTNAQTVNREKYIGVLLKDGTVTAERYLNNGRRPQSPSAACGNDWVRIDVVFGAAATEIYLDGEKAAVVNGGYALKDILGESGILTIGKANWGDGEFYKGWIDNFKIRTVTLSEEEIRKEVSGKSDQEPELPPESGNLPYEDVKEDDWFYDAVVYNRQHGYMQGKDDTHFAPYENLVRAQFAVILHRIEGEPEGGRDKTFPDVPEGEWYTDAILWAAGKEVGIITGYTSSGLFGTADPINREQMAVMMYRYARFREYNVDKKDDFDRFVDAGQVSGYAAEAMRWAVGNGIITGKDEGTRIDPQGNASRGECAIIIQRFMETYL